MRPEEKNAVLTKAYREYFNEIEDWPYFHSLPEYEIYTKDSNPAPLPLLIRECGRLIPVNNPKTGYVDFHPFNMPETRIKRLQIVGTIVGLKIHAKYMEIDVCDGTGCIMVLYGTDKYECDVKRRNEIDRKYEVPAENMTSFERLMKQKIIDHGSGNPTIKQRIQLQKAKKSWWEECRHGMLGKPLVCGGYVTVYGFCNLKRTNPPDNNEGNNFWKFDALPIMIINAYDVKSLSEKQYNEKLQGWINGIVKKKYTVG